MERARPFLDWYGVLFYDSRYVTHNPLTPKSDSHVIYPCNIYVIQKTGNENTQNYQVEGVILI